MTARHHSYLVVLEKDVREDDAESTIAAIGHIRGVLSVEPCETNFDSLMAETRAKRELIEMLFDVIHKLNGTDKR